MNKYHKLKNQTQNPTPTKLKINPYDEKPKSNVCYLQLAGKEKKRKQMPRTKTQPRKTTKKMKRMNWK